jgi:RNA polymerase sigma-70 factor (ECF subfamily)
LRSADAGCGWLRAILVNAYRDRIRRDARTVDEIPVDDVADFSLYRILAEVDPFPYSDSLHVDFLHALGREDVREVLLLPATTGRRWCCDTSRGLPPRR